MGIGNLPEEARRAQVRVLRPGEAAPGQEAQIDYGRLGMWTDPAIGLPRHLHPRRLRHSRP